jgi:hypothetical protein
MEEPPAPVFHCSRWATRLQHRGAGRCFTPAANAGNSLTNLPSAFSKTARKTDLDFSIGKRAAISTIWVSTFHGLYGRVSAHDSDFRVLFGLPVIHSQQPGPWGNVCNADFRTPMHWSRPKFSNQLNASAPQRSAHGEPRPLHQQTHPPYLASILRETSILHRSRKYRGRS